jgi:hypothetical protein
MVVECLQVGYVSKDPVDYRVSVKSIKMAETTGTLHLMHVNTSGRKMVVDGRHFGLNGKIKENEMCTDLDAC